VWWCLLLSGKVTFSENAMSSTGSCTRQSGRNERTVHDANQSGAHVSGREQMA
jgi:hypothetical protein